MKQTILVFSSAYTKYLYLHKELVHMWKKQSHTHIQVSSGFHDFQVTSQLVKWDRVGHRRTGINVNIVCSVLSCHYVPLNLQHWALEAMSARQIVSKKGDRGWSFCRKPHHTTSTRGRYKQMKLQCRLWWDASECFTAKASQFCSLPPPTPSSLFFASSLLHMYSFIITLPQVTYDRVSQITLMVACFLDVCYLF